MAFQKVEGLARTGGLNAGVFDALTRASRPAPSVKDGEATRVEIDLRRQVLLYWTPKGLTRVLNISTGSGQRYCVAGKCELAVTPKGTFRIERKIDGNRVAALGTLYHPMYFSGGVAIHGSPSVPGQPASHGCARIPMYAAVSFFHQVAVGTAVYVL